MTIVGRTTFLTKTEYPGGGNGDEIIDECVFGERKL